MQLTNDTADWVCKKLEIDCDTINLFTPDDNIKLGCYYLRYLIDKYDGNVNVAVAAYNAGPAKVDGWLEEKEHSKDGKDLNYIPYKETRDYVKKVNKQWKKYAELY